MIHLKKKLDKKLDKKIVCVDKNWWAKEADFVDCELEIKKKIIVRKYWKLSWSNSSMKIFDVSKIH